MVPEGAAPLGVLSGSRLVPPLMVGPGTLADRHEGARLTRHPLGGAGHRLVEALRLEQVVDGAFVGDAVLAQQGDDPVVGQCPVEGTLLLARVGPLQPAVRLLGRGRHGLVEEGNGTRRIAGAPALVSFADQALRVPEVLALDPVLQLPGEAGFRSRPS